MAGATSLTSGPLRIGEIGYLNVLPLFSHIRHSLPLDYPAHFVQGHPARLNALLATGALDVAPASSFEYLVRADRYRLLPELSISADGPVQSVLLVSPVPKEELQATGALRGIVRLSRASASSVALLRILWQCAWSLPEPQWVECEPGQGAEGDTPYLEIGDLALHTFLNPPKGWHVIDLAEEWHVFTGLPFVFAVWIVNRHIALDQKPHLAELHKALITAKETFPAAEEEVDQSMPLPKWLSLPAAVQYWGCMNYGLGSRELAGLVLYGRYCRDLGMIPGMPVLEWAL